MNAAFLLIDKKKKNLMFELDAKTNIYSMDAISSIIIWALVYYNHVVH